MADYTKLPKYALPGLDRVYFVDRNKDLVYYSGGYCSHMPFSSGPWKDLYPVDPEPTYAGIGDYGGDPWDDMPQHFSGKSVKGVWVDEADTIEDLWKDMRAYKSPSSATSAKADDVNEPSHYTKGTIECINYIEDFLSEEEFIGFLRGNIAKYNHRWREKGGSKDLLKAQWYHNRLIELVLNKKENTQ